MTKRLLRGTSALLVALGIAQPVLAGGFLSGRYDLVAAHLMVGVTMLVVSMVQAVAVVVAFRSGAPRQVLVSGLLLPLLLALQAHLGATRELGPHVPIGVLMVVGLLRMSAWAWGPAPASPETVAA